MRQARSLIADDPGEFVDPVRAKGERQGKRLFKLEQLRVLLEVADPEWRSMILFGLYTVKSGSRVKLVFSGSANNFR